MFLNGESNYIAPLTWGDVNHLDWAQVEGEAWGTTLKRNLVKQYHDIYRVGVSSGNVVSFNGTNNFSVVESMIKIIDPSNSNEVKRLIDAFLGVMKESIDNGSLDSSKLYVVAGEQQIKIDKDVEQKKKESAKPLSELNTTIKILGITTGVVGIAYIIGKLK